MLDHVGVRVRDLDAAVRLYEALLAPLGYMPGSRGTHYAGFGPKDKPGLLKFGTSSSTAPGNVVLFGGPSLATALAAARLIHEIHVVAQPFIGPSPVRAFQEPGARRRLLFMEARPFRSGAVLLRYVAEAYQSAT